MTEGTKSFLFGCHQFFLHPLFVLLAWRKHFKRWPKFWQLICIFIHDIGICGRDYLSRAKDGHWKTGARWSYKWFGMKGFLLCAGHTPESGWPRSALFWADKKSWLIAPMWWLWSNFYLEKFNGYQVSHPIEWKKMVARNLKRKNPKGSHELFIEEWRMNDGT